MYTETEEDRNPGKSRAELHHRKSLEPQYPAGLADESSLRGIEVTPGKTQDGTPWISA